MKTIRFLIVLAAAVSTTQVADAGLFGFGKPAGCGEAVATGCCTAPCPACSPKTEMVKVTRTCFKPKRVPICVPPIKFPWMKCNEFGTPRIRCVNRFDKEEIDCGEKCVIVWELNEELARGYCKCNTGGCLSRGCSGCSSCAPTTFIGGSCTNGCTDGCTGGCGDPGGSGIVGSVP